MRGCITERDFDEAEHCFPGIAAYYRDLACKPATFLELVWAFMADRCKREEAQRAPARTSSL